MFCQTSKLVIVAIFATTIVKPAVFAEKSNDIQPVVGLERMAHPELLPFFFPAGTVTRQESCYCPSGTNRDWDIKIYGKYVDEHGDIVIFDEYGPGCLSRQHINIWVSKKENTENVRIKYYFDDEAKPRIDELVTPFFRGKIKPFDGVLSYGDRKNAVLYYPFPFAKRLKVTITFDANKKRTYQWNQFTHIIYPANTKITSWQGKNVDSSLVRSIWNDVGKDPKSIKGNKAKTTNITVSPGKSTVLLDYKGQGSIAAIKLKMNEFNQEVFCNTYIKMTWDNNKSSVDMPLGYFFGGGGIKDKAWGKVLPATSPQGKKGKEQKWKGIFKNLFYGFDINEKTFYAYWSMPFWDSAKIELVNKSKGKM